MRDGGERNSVNGSVGSCDCRSVDSCRRCENDLGVVCAAEEEEVDAADDEVVVVVDNITSGCKSVSD